MFLAAGWQVCDRRELAGGDAGLRCGSGVRGLGYIVRQQNNLPLLRYFHLPLGLSHAKPIRSRYYGQLRLPHSRLFHPRASPP